MSRVNRDMASMSVPRTRSLWQGGKIEPKVFLAALDAPAAKFITLCRKKDLGVYLDGVEERISLLLFADNWWLLAETKA